MTAEPPSSPSTPPPLWGLVLSGGMGSRVGQDKGRLDFHGRPQACWAYERLAAVCARAYVSVRAEQASEAPYTDLPLVRDLGESHGPASGLRSAWAVHPGVAWLVLAADMPLISTGTLARLVAGRDSLAVATGFRHADGTIEPLCAIWEPKAAALVESGGHHGSLRRILEASGVRVLEIGDPTQLRSVNTPQDDAAARARLSR